MTAQGLKAALIPQNGNGVDWNQVVRTWTPIAVLVVTGISTFMLWLSGNVVSGETREKEARAIAREVANATLDEREKFIRAIAREVATSVVDGRIPSPELIEAVKRIEEDVNDIKGEVEKTQSLVLRFHLKEP